MNIEWQKSWPNKRIPQKNLRPEFISTVQTMTRFRPCIDLHAGSVKQIVGGTLSTDNAGLKTNFTSEHPAAYFAELYKSRQLTGGHVIMLGPGNEAAAREALAAWPGGLQVGGGIKDSNAKSWIEAGAERVREARTLAWCG